MTGWSQMSATGCKKNLADLENVDTRGVYFWVLFVASENSTLLRSSPSQRTGVVGDSVPGRSPTMDGGW